MPSAVEALGAVEAWHPGGREPENWRILGICSQADEDPEMWCTPTIAARRAAMHRCREHCPVQAVCLAFVAASSGIVVGGVAHGERNAKPLKADRRLPLERCPRCTDIDTLGGVR